MARYHKLPLQDGVEDYAFLEDLQAGGIVNSTLIIRESQSRHFGTYKCNVSNDYGSDILKITLKPNKTFPLLLILFGVTSGTILVAALIMMVILCQRKQRKNKQVTEKPDVTVTAEELFKENDRNSNISDLKLELRQANGSCEIDYSNTGSDSTLCSNAKLGSGVALSGAVQLSTMNQNNTYQPYRYSNDYNDPAYADCYKVNGFGNGYQTYVHYGHDYTPGSLRVQSPTLGSDKLTPNRSVNGSLPRSVDTSSTVKYNPGNGSQNNSLQRSAKRQDSNNALNNLGLPTTEVNRIPNGGILHGVDVRYAATYGNPHLRSGGGLGFATVNTAKPASTPAPPPYSSVRSSVILPLGTSSHSITSPTSLASPQCTTSPITTSTMSTDSTQPPVGVATSSATPQSPSAHYILAPSSRTIASVAVTKKVYANTIISLNFVTNLIGCLYGSQECLVTKRERSLSKRVTRFTVWARNPKKIPKLAAKAVSWKHRRRLVWKSKPIPVSQLKHSNEIIALMLKSDQGRVLMKRAFCAETTSVGNLYQASTTLLLKKCLCGFIDDALFVNFR
ncbi:unnamed protein product [Diatraea saccharalis]|uniref:Uncharacterized protein n=1 Tax=Diatraea saccharalis TaxID=40085 RepID=A0A9N9R604_9NEOP|nr:unnamed protein product [Diatraea saccharalis]